MTMSIYNIYRFITNYEDSSVFIFLIRQNFCPVWIELLVLINKILAFGGWG